MIDHDLIRNTPDTRTWARVTTFESQVPEHVERALRRAVDETIPLARDLAGWKGALALATETRQRGLVVTFWDSVENLMAGGRSFAELGREEGRDPDVVAGIQRFEVVHDERPDEEA